MSKKRIKNYSGRNFKKRREDDKISKKKRSSLMSKIRSKNTKFEDDFINLLNKSTRKKIRTHVANIKGKPDIVFDKRKVCVFLDSDFWHGWQYPRWKHLLKNDFWCEKIERNRDRDKKTTVFLRRQGWRVVRIWEHQVKGEIAQRVAESIDKLG
ncbi:MAG: very short patch repair endonuclease [Candidatus Omnitrophica bacterium]|nr:very short patch repair endonuclease [Candidatus Omnitrophota bacterium]MBU1925207.1 very short patch repair endonuclease [Candidatus Omnitrophota bacterium]